MMAAPSPVKLVLGTMEMGRRANDEQSKDMIEAFANREIARGSPVELDTALMYGGGETERLLGRKPNAEAVHDSSRVLIATKANPWGNKLTADGVTAQLNRSLASLSMSSVDLFYLHAPDHNTTIEETLAAVDVLHKEGKFKRFGLSNYAAWQVAEIVLICRLNNYIQPTVYQGMYNSITRSIESELIPCLRHFGLAFYAYNPLAGGLLSGKYSYKDIDESRPTGRFFAATKAGELWAGKYRDRFWKESYFTAIDKVKDALSRVDNGNMSMAQASIKWLLHHSKLQNGDAVILGASNITHLTENMAAEMGPPLPDSVVTAFDMAWEEASADCPQYFR